MVDIGIKSNEVDNKFSNLEMKQFDFNNALMSSHISSRGSNSQLKTGKNHANYFFQSGGGVSKTNLSGKNAISRTKQ